jgi:ankyrin repeat protein
MDLNAASTNASAQTRALTLPAAPDSPVSGAAFRRAAERGDIPKLRSLFDLGVDVNSRDADDRSALLLAVLNGRSDVVNLLLTHGADVNAADRGGTTPLQAAESTHQPGIAATLRAAGAH